MNTSSESCFSSNVCNKAIKNQVFSVQPVHCNEEGHLRRRYEGAQGRKHAEFRALHHDWDHLFDLWRHLKVNMGAHS